MSSIKKNYLYNSAYQILAILTPLITSPYISRVLGATGLGIYSYTYAVANYFLVFAMLGVKNYGNRCIAKARDDKQELSRVFWEIYAFQCLLSVVVSVVYVAYLVLACDTNIEVATIQILLVLSATFDISWFFFGMEEFKLTTTRNIIVKLLTVISILVFVKRADQVWLYTLIMAGGVLISQVIMWPFLKGRVIWVRPSVKGIIKHIKPNIILFVPVIATNVYKYMDKLMLGNMSAIEEVGYYENAEKIIKIPDSLITALGTVMLPRMSNLVQKHEDGKSKEIIEKSMLFVVFMSVAFAFGIVSVSDVFVPWFFGPGFESVIPLLNILTPAMVFISWSNVIGTQYLLPHEKDRSYLTALIFGAIVNVIINAILIPNYASTGAAAGTFAAELVMCIMQSFMARKELPILKYVIDAIPFVLDGIVMYFAIRWITVGSTLLTIIARIGCGAIIYSVIAIFILFVMHRELLMSLFNEFKKMIVRRK